VSSIRAKDIAFGDDDSSDGGWWDDDEFEDNVSSPLDHIDPFVLFIDTLQELETAGRGLTSSVDDNMKAQLQALAQVAEEKRKEQLEDQQDINFPRGPPQVPLSEQQQMLLLQQHQQQQAAMQQAALQQQQQQQQHQ